MKEDGEIFMWEKILKKDMPMIGAKEIVERHGKWFKEHIQSLFDNKSITNGSISAKDDKTFIVNLTLRGYGKINMVVDYDPSRTRQNVKITSNDLEMKDWLKNRENTKVLEDGINSFIRTTQSDLMGGEPHEMLKPNQTWGNKLEDSESHYQSKEGLWNEVLQNKTPDIVGTELVNKIERLSHGKVTEKGMLWLSKLQSEKGNTNSYKHYKYNDFKISVRGTDAELPDDEDTHMFYIDLQLEKPLMTETYKLGPVNSRNYNKSELEKILREVSKIHYNLTR